jgi:translation elongation factor EF-Ts
VTSFWQTVFSKYCSNVSSTWWSLQEVKEQVDKVGQQLAMHAAGMRPLFLTQAAVPEELLDYERETLRQQVCAVKLIHLSRAPSTGVLQNEHNCMFPWDLGYCFYRASMP